MGNTITLHRVFKAPAARVYKAFLQPDALCKWLPPSGFTCKVHHQEPVVGGTFRMSFHELDSGEGNAFGGTYLELVPGERLRYTNMFENPNLPGDILVTVELRAVSCGTEVSITQANVPAVIPSEMCYLGWQDSLRQLAMLVETP